MEPPPLSKSNSVITTELGMSIGIVVFEVQFSGLESIAARHAANSFWVARGMALLLGIAASWHIVAAFTGGPRLGGVAIC